jgi:hypothetical protein
MNAKCHARNVFRKGKDRPGITKGSRFSNTLLTLLIRVVDPDPDPYWIRIQSGLWIRIRIRNPDPDPGGQKDPQK